MKRGDAQKYLFVFAYELAREERIVEGCVLCNTQNRLQHWIEKVLAVVVNIYKESAVVGCVAAGDENAAAFVVIARQVDLVVCAEKDVFKCKCLHVVSTAF